MRIALVREKTVRLPRDRDLRSPELEERFAKAQQAQVQRERDRAWLESAIAAGTKKPAAPPSNVMVFGARRG